MKCSGKKPPGESPAEKKLMIEYEKIQAEQAKAKLLGSNNLNVLKSSSPTKPGVIASSQGLKSTGLLGSTNMRQQKTDLTEGMSPTGSAGVTFTNPAAKETAQREIDLRATTQYPDGQSPVGKKDSTVGAANAAAGGA